MNFEVFTTSVELQDIPSYTTNITLEGQTLRLSFLWNERLGKRVLSVKSSTDVTYLQNTILYPNESFELNSNAVYDDLPYKVVLQKTGDVNRVGNLYNWSKEYILVFYRTVDVEVEKLNVTYGVTKPSTPTLPPIIKPEPPEGDCAGATKSATVGMCTGGGILEYFINDVSIGDYLGRNVYDGSLESKGLRVIPIKEDGSVDAAPYYDETMYQKFENLTSSTIRVRVKTVDADYINQELSPLNPTVVFSADNISSYVEFCLLPID